MKQRFFGQLYPVNLLLSIILVIFFTFLISRLFPDISPRSLEIERVLAQ